MTTVRKTVDYDSRWLDREVLLSCKGGRQRSTREDRWEGRTGAVIAWDRRYDVCELGIIGSGEGTFFALDGSS